MMKPHTLPIALLLLWVLLSPQLAQACQNGMSEEGGFIVVLVMFAIAALPVIGVIVAIVLSTLFVGGLGWGVYHLLTRQQG